MKKIFKVTLILLISVLLVGCASKGNAKGKSKIGELSYVDPENYTRKETPDLGSENEVVKFFFKEEDKTIAMYYYKNKKWTSMFDEKEYDAITINGTKWMYNIESMSGVRYKNYFTEYQGNLYLIELTGIDNYNVELERFMDNVEFE